MDGSRFDRLTARFRLSVTGVPRRRLLQGIVLGAAAGGPRFNRVTAAKPKLCRKTGAPCRRAGKACKGRYCLRDSFTIEAVWTNLDSDHDSYLFLPQQTGSTDPFPFIDYRCNNDFPECDVSYPFACVSGDAASGGDEITAVRKVLNGRYEYWIGLDAESPAGDLTIRLRRRDGSLVRRWVSPANLGEDKVGWHVFDIDGETGRVSAADQLADSSMPAAAHDPNTIACPV